MAYIKRKKIKGRIYYYLAESYREGSKVKTRTLKYLGTELPAKATTRHSPIRRRSKPALTKVERETLREIQGLFGGFIRFVGPGGTEIES